MAASSHRLILIRTEILHGSDLEYQRERCKLDSAGMSDSVLLFAGTME